MECGCSIDPGIEHDWWALRVDDDVCLNRAVTCTECNKEIHAGEASNAFLGIDKDGEVFVFFTCADCLSIRDTYFCSWIFSHVWEDLLDDVSDRGVDAFLDGRLMKLTPAARARMLCELQRHICAGCGEALSCQDGENDDTENPLCIDCLEAQEQAQ